MKRVSQVTMYVVSVMMVGFSATANADQTKKVTVHVKGVACPFCVYNIEKRIKTLKAVSQNAKFKSNIKEGTVSFDWNIEVPFSADAIRRQIRKAGFTPGKVEVVESKPVNTPKSKTPKVTVKQKQPVETSFAGVAKLIRLKQKTEHIQLLDTRTKSTIAIQLAERADRRESHRTLLAFMRHQNNDSQKAYVKIYGQVLDKGSEKLILHRWEPLYYAAGLSIKVKSLACEQCSLRMMRTLDPLKGVLHVEANFADDTVQLWMRSKTPDTAALRKAIEESGQEVITVKVSPGNEQKDSEPKKTSPKQADKGSGQQKSK